MFTEKNNIAMNRATSASRQHPLTRYAALLTTPFLPDDFIHWLNPLWTRETLYARVESVAAETADASTITLQPGVRWAGHRAGQYLRIGVAIAGVRHTRCYSIASAPERADGRITLTVKAVADGRVSTHLAHQLTVGTVLDIAAAEGDFSMPYALNAAALLIAAGSGITPIMALLRSAAARKAMPVATLLYYTPSATETIFHAELLAMAAAHPALTVHFIYTRTASDSALRGHFSSAHLSLACADWQARRTWACGPAALLDAIEAQWTVQGLRAQLMVERFRPALRATADDTSGGTLHFTSSEVHAERVDNESILETAERAGLAPAHGCRMGICHGCTARLICGQVRDLRDGRIHSDENDLIQICVSAPIGAVQIAL